MRLSLSSNRLSRLPPELGRLGMLRQLLLDENALEGALPQELGGWVMGAGHVHAPAGTCLVARVPTVRGASQSQARPQHPQTVAGGCSALVELSACGNRLDAIPPALAGCSQLEALRLERNRWGGSWPLC